MALPTRRGNEGSSRSSEVEAPASGFPRTVPLTVKLSGRPEVPQARQSAITLSAHEAPTHPTVHGPLQRLLEVRPHRLPLCACGAVAATAADRAPVCSAPSWQTELLRTWRAALQARTAA